MKKLVLVLGLLVAVVAISSTQLVSRHKSTEQSVEEAEIALGRQQFEQARALADQVLQRHPSETHLLIIAAQASVAVSDWASANAYFARIPADDQPFAIRRFVELGDECRLHGLARRAENYLRMALQYDPQNEVAVRDLALLLGAEGRTWEASPYFRQLIENEPATSAHLWVVGATELFFLPDRDFIANCLKAVPEDRLPLLAVGRKLILDDEKPAALKTLLEVIAFEPTLVEAQVRLGYLLLDGVYDKPFPDWDQEVGEAGDWHPEIWVIRGHFAIKQQEPRVAIRCFLEAARRDPNSLAAHRQLAHLFQEIGDSGSAHRFQHRADLLTQLVNTFAQSTRHCELADIHRITTLCHALGRYREAVAWASLLLPDSPYADSAREMTNRIKSSQPQSIPWILDETRLAAEISVDLYPLPSWGSASHRAHSKLAGSAIGDSSLIRFTEDAAPLGIQFKYYNDAKSSKSTGRVFEYNGGGLGVIDYDNDDWPDLYAVQGSRFPIEPDPATYLDRIFRNQLGMNFIDVTNSAQVQETGYGQGIAVGDIDQDGFADIYVANIGPDRLLRNNGDGTFSDITRSANLADNDWTTSCLMADLNGDSWPEIFCVNYLTAPDVYTRQCHDGSPDNRCLPFRFDPEHDRVWVNVGDGTFEDRSSVLSDEKFSGRGLGVVAIAINDPGRPDIFVANDTDPNFWYANQSVKGGQLKFDEHGVISGLATNGEGQTQACMGIAAGDVDRDGRVDFLVTNYFREASTLYLQQPQQFFLDGTREWRLYAPSKSMLGFGAQFLDVDCDGWLDLVVTNGHVFNNTALNEPWKMRPQVFRNSTKGYFIELPSEQLGPFFQGQYLGRSLIRWDWNRDGLYDFAISHLDVPLAVLTNRLSGTHQSLILHLRGVESNREAIGAIIDVVAGTEHWTATLTAGDGYLASNERRILIGMGTHSVAEEVVIRWPSGKTETHRQLGTGQEHLLIEGRQPVVLWTTARNAAR